MGNGYLPLCAVVILGTATVSSVVEMGREQTVAKKAVHQLNLGLHQKLTETIRKEGAAGAVDVCAKDAPEIIARIERELGVTVKRTSLKLRNPQNTPDPAEAELLEALAASDLAGESLPQGVATFPNDSRRFYKVIKMERICLQCHGQLNAMSKAVREELSASYPEDKAVGYEEGEFRGIISVTVK
jgi:hypothetical protein